MLKCGALRSALDDDDDDDDQPAEPMSDVSEHRAYLLNSPKIRVRKTSLSRYGERALASSVNFSMLSRSSPLFGLLARLD